MSITVELTDIKVLPWIVYPETQTVKVSFEYEDSTGNSWKQGGAVFWTTLPDLPVVDELTGEIIYTEYPDNWFQIPPAYAQTLIDLHNAIDTALTGRFLP